MFIYLYRYCAICLLCCLFIALLHASSMGVLLSLYLYSILVPYFDLYFFSKCRNYADRYTLLGYKQKTASDL